MQRVKNAEQTQRQTVLLSIWRLNLGMRLSPLSRRVYIADAINISRASMMRATEDLFLSRAQQNSFLEFYVPRTMN